LKIILTSKTKIKVASNITHNQMKLLIIIFNFTSDEIINLSSYIHTYFYNDIRNYAKDYIKGYINNYKICYINNIIGIILVR